DDGMFAEALSAIGWRCSRGKRIAMTRTNRQPPTIDQTRRELELFMVAHSPFRGLKAASARFHHGRDATGEILQPPRVFPDFCEQSLPTAQRLRWRDQSG